MTTRCSSGRLTAARCIAAALCLTAAGFGKPVDSRARPMYPASSGHPGSAAAADVMPGELQFTTVPANAATLSDTLVFATSGTAEFGDLIRLHGASHFVGRVAIAMSSGASHRDFPDRSPLGFSHPITLTLYAVDRSQGVPRPGELLSRVTETFLIPWRWESTPGGTPANRAFVLTFDLAPLGLALPSDVIYSVSFDTEFYGDTPLGRAGPFNSLAVGLSREPPEVGTDVEPNVLFWRSTHSGVLSLVADAGWAPFTPAVRFHDSAYGLLFETAIRLETLRGPNASAAATISLAASLLAAALDRDFWDGNFQPAPAFGHHVFDLLAETADELARAATNPGALAREAQSALDLISRTTAHIAEAALADALILGGNVEAVIRAQTAAELASESQLQSDHGSAISDFGAAWAEAQRSLR